MNVGLRAALSRTTTIVVFAILPVVSIGGMLAVGLDTDSLAADFHHELYPQSKLLLDGVNPYPDPSWDPRASPNFIWPPLAGYLVAPLTLLPLGAADVAMAFIGLACFGVALWLVGLRDWRVYGLVCLWPEVIGEMRLGHLTPVLALLLAAAWRWRDVRGGPGTALGLALGLKFFIWPVAVWLAATRRTRDATLAVAIAGASLLLVLPYTGLDEYVRSLLKLGRTFDQDGYTPFGVLVHGGVPDSVARGLTFAIGFALLAATWRYRSFALAIAASLVLSPIVWLDFFALAALPLVIARPRLSWVWFVPLTTWGLKGAGLGIGSFTHSLRLPLVFSVVFVVAFLAERASDGAGPPRVSGQGAPGPALSGRSSTA